MLDLIRPPNTSKARLRHKIFQTLIFKGPIAKKQQSVKHAIEPTRAQPELASEVPEWFLKHRVKTAQDLIECNIPLIVREDVTLSHDSNQGSVGLDAMVYEIDSAVYEPLRQLLISQMSSAAYMDKSGPEPARFFKNDAANGGSQFLTAVVEYFAKDAGADLITLGLDDINDFAEHLRLSGCLQAKLDVHSNETTDDETMDEYHARFDDALKNYENLYIENAQNSKTTDLPLTILLSSAGIKSAKSLLQTKTPDNTPLIVHLSKINSLLNVYGSKFVHELRDALMEVTSNSLIISTFTDQELSGRRCREGRQESWVSKATRRLFDKHRKLEDSHENENIRQLQRSIRQLSAKLRSLPIAQPYADWGFLEGTSAQEELIKHAPDKNEMAEIVCNLRQDSKEGYTVDQCTEDGHVTDADTKEAILTFGRREKALEDWCDSAEDEARASKWSSFPSQAQLTIRKIEDDESFEWEQRFLNLLINPDDVGEGWSEIALDSDIKEAIQQLIHQPSNTGVHSYGILKRGRIGGALLYGPPGTGKTHLARVLAHESKAITICASAADIENEYVGETEKAIRGLFNLGRMLSPCTIFLDEADALFRSRKSNDRGWERSQINQLLHEMDGLKKHKSSPFVLLATNFPHDLDHAVLRRVPSRIHIGLPSPEARQQIFQICLADETLHPEVDLCHLVDQSQGYSGSDIQTVCVHAALICDTIVGGDAKRYLMKHHFDKAFQRSAPTVSKAALAGIKAFAKDNDPAAFEHMERRCNVGHVPRKLFPSVPL
ncbi:MAG: hypothetical protein Q9225_006425 [Loekoesia sp. 1 TL-2023]